MVRFSILALLAVGCASASTQPEPRLGERVVVVEAPGPTTVIVEGHGHYASGGYVKSKHADSRDDVGSKRHGKSKRDAKAKLRKMPEHRAKGTPPGRGGRHPSKWAKGQRCEEKPTAEAREHCRRKTARRRTPSPTFGF